MPTKHTLLVVLRNGKRIKIKFETLLFGASSAGQYVHEKLAHEFFQLGGHCIRTSEIKRTRILKSENGKWVKRN